MAEPPSRWASPLLAVVLLVAWTARVWLLTPWEHAWPLLTRAGTDTALRWIILGGLPLLWAATVEAPLSWRAVLYPIGRHHRSLPVWALLACMGYLASLIPYAPDHPRPDTLHLFFGLSRHTGPLIGSFGVLASFAAVAVVEETLFRGYFLGRFYQLWGFARAALLQSALFAAIHLPGWGLSGQTPALEVLALAGAAFAYGLVAAVVVFWGGSVVWGFALHTTVNLINAGAWPLIVQSIGRL